MNRYLFAGKWSFAVVVLLLGRVAHAQIVITPPGLAPGSEYRLVFVTSTTRDAVPSDINTYNAYVSSVANSQPALAALGTIWTAIVSTSSVDARDNTNTNWTVVGEGVPFFRLDGLRVAPHNSYFWNMAFPESTISFTETGTRTPITVQSSTMGEAPWVWTGTTSGGTKSTGYLGVNGGSSANFPVAAVAHNDVTGPYSWIGLATTPILDVHSLYGMSGILTVPGDPHFGDYNEDGSVDAADYTVWRDRFGSATSLPNDPTPGVGTDDYTLWVTNFGSFSGSGALAATLNSTSIPEPASGAILLAYVLCVALPRHRRSGV